MKKIIHCPICSKMELESLYYNKVPVLQNRVYLQKSDALNAAEGEIDLTYCQSCNFIFNGAFDESLIEYNADYDNSVPSKIFEVYYKEICHYLYNSYKLENSVVVDIGCGKGTFLYLMCTLFPSIKGVGIDPSYVGALNPLPNLTFIQDFFNISHVSTKPDLIISRHVLEHITAPKEFLDLIKVPISLHQDIPIFIEVPDFTWIVQNQTFWDICYEHCNYFTPYSISQLFQKSSLKVSAVSKGFGDQYLWIEGVLNPSNSLSVGKSAHNIELDRIRRFVESIDSGKIHALNFIRENKNNQFKIVVWGMATKGVIFANEIDREQEIIDFCVDINIEKQGKFIPVSGHLIQNPNILKELIGHRILIIIMNTNYENEIKECVSEFGLNVVYTDAHGVLL
ncbi:MAG: class I SAM-dependent methyltransferase [Chitinophagaceae bacterium]